MRAAGSHVNRYFAEIRCLVIAAGWSMLGPMFEETDDQYQAEALFEDLIESAYLEALIDGEQQKLAYLWLANNQKNCH